MITILTDNWSNTLFICILSKHLFQIQMLVHPGLNQAFKVPAIVMISHLQTWA